MAVAGDRLLDLDEGGCTADRCRATVSAERKVGKYQAFNGQLDKRENMNK
jgi:hypothetical protein